MTTTLCLFDIVIKTHHQIVSKLLLITIETGRCVTCQKYLHKMEALLLKVALEVLKFKLDKIEAMIIHWKHYKLEASQVGSITGWKHHIKMEASQMQVNKLKASQT